MESAYFVGYGTLLLRGSLGQTIDSIERDPTRLLPFWRDVVWARSGAYRISEAFGRMYDETTYLADGRSLMVERYREVLEDTDDVEIPE